MKKGRKPVLLVATGAAIALVAGGLFGYWLSANQKRVLAGLPAGSEVLPQDVLMTLTLTTDNGQWRRLREFGTPQTQSMLNDKLTELRDRLITNNGYNYDRDIKPWVGDEVTIAFFPPVLQDLSASPSPAPPDAAPLAREKSAAVVILPIADPARAQQILAKPKYGANQKIDTREYKGLQLREVDGEGDQDYVATALDDKFLVVATDDQAIKQVVDTYRGGTPLNNTAGYRDAFTKTAVSRPLMRIYLNAPEVKKLAEANSTQAVPLMGLTPIQKNQGIATTVTLEPNGMRFQGMSWLPSDSQVRYAVNNSAGKAADLLPLDTLVMVSGGSLRQFWEGYMQQAGVDPRNPFNPNTFQEGVRANTDMDWNQDFLSWMDGEFSLAMVPIPNTRQPQQAALVWTVQTSDRPKAEASLAKLDEVMSSKHRYQVSQAQINGLPVVNWVSPFGSLSVTHGWINDRTAFLAMGTPVVNALLPKPKTSLQQNPAFQGTVSPDLAAHNGHFFIDLDRLLRTETTVPMPGLPKGGEAFLSAIRTLGVTGAIQSDRSTRFDIRLILRKVNDPDVPPTPPSIPPANSPEGPVPEVGPRM